MSCLLLQQGVIYNLRIHVLKPAMKLENLNLTKQFCCLDLSKLRHWSRSIGNGHTIVILSVIDLLQRVVLRMCC